MTRCNSILTTVALLCLALFATPVSADVHAIVVNEYYTQCDDASTSVQYIELRSIALGNFFRQCASIEIKRTVGGANLFFAKPVFAGKGNAQTFPNNGTFLIGTPAFQAISGVTPDLVIPNGTLNPAGGVIRFAADSGCATNWGTIHEVRYGDQGTAPAPGPNQAANFRTTTFTFSLGDPTPRNFAGATASSWSCIVVPVEPTSWSRIKVQIP